LAVLIPAMGSCAARMTSGERRLAERLEQKLDDDYLMWYDPQQGILHLTETRSSQRRPSADSRTAGHGQTATFTRARAQLVVRVCGRCAAVAALVEVR
jgi:hypothetical protein